MYGGMDAGEPPDAKSVEAEVSCVEPEERFEGSEKVEYCESGCVLVWMIDELVEVGSRE